MAKSERDPARSSPASKLGIFDPSGRLAADYGVLGLPSTFVVDGSQRIRFQFTGYLTASRLREALDELLSGASP